MGNQQEESQIGNPWRFASKRYDNETDFLFFGRRYYSPELGRFLTPDPLGFADGPNLYAYVSNRPLTLLDPYGLTAIEDTKLAASSAVSSYATSMLHPMDCLERNVGYGVHGISMLYNACSTRDFSPISQLWNTTSREQMIQFASERIGDIGALATYAYGATWAARSTGAYLAVTTPRLYNWISGTSATTQSQQVLPHTSTQSTPSSIRQISSPLVENGVRLGKNGQSRSTPSIEMLPNYQKQDREIFVLSEDGLGIRDG